MLKCLFTLRFWGLALGYGLLSLAVVATYLGCLQIDGNFHVVAQGELYRSAQPTPADIRKASETYGVKTVLNLRGPSPKAQWYRQEVSEAAELGLTHIDFRMSASRELSQTEIASLVTILRSAPKPILVHCQAGADRSGLVAAIYLNRINGVEIEDAERQISLFYGHISIPYLSRAYAMDRTWEKLEHADDKLQTAMAL